MQKTVPIVCILMFVLSVPFIVAEKQQIPYVDINEAEQRISNLEAENEEFAQESEQMQQENVELESDIQEWQQQISEIETILERVKQKGADLYAIYSDIVDKETKEKALATIQRNRELRDQLEDKKESLQKKAKDAREQMSENTKQIRINNNKTARNIDTINLLTASIEKTKNQTQVLNSYIGTVEEINEEASKFLGDASSSE